MELTSLDYEILEFINRFDVIEKSKIINQFLSRIDSIEYRLELLSKVTYTPSGSFIANSNYIQEINKCHTDAIGVMYSDGTDTFYITDKGKSALQDYQLKKQNERIKNRRDIALKILPIVISGLSLLLSCYAIFIAAK
jgi:hypothetical protein